MFVLSEKIAFNSTAAEQDEEAAAYTPEFRGMGLQECEARGRTGKEFITAGQSGEEDCLSEQARSCRLSRESGDICR